MTGRTVKKLCIIFGVIFLGVAAYSGMGAVHAIQVKHIGFILGIGTRALLCLAAGVATLHSGMYYPLEK